MGFPEIRLRRLRKSDAVRRLVRETSLSVDDLVYPLFVREGKKLKEPIKSMTDCYHFSPDTIAAEAKEIAKLGIPAVLLFGLPGKKDDMGSQAWAEDGVVQRAIGEIKKAAPELLVITDICLCEYTSHGHCGEGSLHQDRMQKNIPSNRYTEALLEHERNRRIRKRLRRKYSAITEMQERSGL